MKKFILASITGGSLLYGACTHHPPQPSSQSADSLAQSDTTGRSFFPVGEVLESEIRQIDSTPIGIRKFVTDNGRTDSAFIKPAEFDALAGQFLVPEFRNGQFRKAFTESAFIDNSTQTANFTYSTTDKEIPLQRVDVVAIPQGTDDQVKSIYLERLRTSGDSSILDKMYWQTGRQFQVISLIRVKDGAPTQRQLKVIWATGDQSAGDNE